MKKHLSIWIVSGALLAPAIAMAAPQARANHAGHAASQPETAAQKEFRALDKNRDGKLTKAEMPAKHPMAAHFAMMDTDKDGVLSEAEYIAH